MRTELGVEDLSGFLEEPVVAILATLRDDGSVLLSPVWHEWRDGGFNVWTGWNDVKSRHLRRDPRSSIVVAESGFPNRGIEVRAEARLARADATDTAIRIASRYLGPERGEAYVRKVGGNDVTIRLEPGDLRVWDFADEREAMGPER